jgi:hypothetical protein
VTTRKNIAALVDRKYALRNMLEAARCLHMLAQVRILEQDLAAVEQELAS